MTEPAGSTPHPTPADTRAQRGRIGAFGSLLWSAYPPAMWVCMIGIVVSGGIGAALGAWIPRLQGSEALFILLWMGGVMAWIVVHDSKRRWPHLSMQQRWTTVITFDARRHDAVARRSREEAAPSSPEGIGPAE